MGNLKSAVALLICGKEQGTAFLISNTLALTMSHCVEDAIENGEDIKLAFKNISGQDEINIKASIVSYEEDYPVSVLRLDNEIQIVNKTKKITDEIMKLYVGSNDIVSYDMAWENCPIVLTGINLAKGGHSLPSTKKLFRGDTIYFDFGIKATFSDEMVLYTDMQRMGYALKKNEFSPPKQVMKVFNTLVNSISDGIDEMRPGVKAYKVDKVVRDEIIKAGYPEYNHATGHPVGKEVHDIGAIISIKKSKLANLELIENGVYTLEPRVNISNGGSIEEMIQVTKYGGVPLTHLQDEIYLVK